VINIKNNLLITIVIAIAVAGAAFFAGVKYQKAQTPSMPNLEAMRGMMKRNGSELGHQSGAQAIRGEVIDQDEGSLTIKLPDESSKIILISENTTINKASEGSIDDLATGEQVMVFGRSNSDGSISATQVQLNFVFREDMMKEGQN
jgi:hypothetical protein